MKMRQTADHRKQKTKRNILFEYCVSFFIFVADTRVYPQSKPAFPQAYPHQNSCSIHTICYNFRFHFILYSICARSFPLSPQFYPQKILHFAIWTRHFSAKCTIFRTLPASCAAALWITLRITVHICG